MRVGTQGFVGHTRPMNIETAAHGRFQEVSWTPVTGSTNADLVRHAQHSPTVAAVLFADEQTAGRGRRDRRWEMAPGGGLLVSFFVPWVPVADAHVVPTALGVAAVEAIAETSREVALKWPNDLVTMDGRKLGGMLSEAVWVEGKFVGVVAGLGCNVSWPDAEAREYLPDAANLDELGSGQVDRTALAAGLIGAFDNELETVVSLGVDHSHVRYRERCATLGTTVRIDQGDNVVVGVATDVSTDGALIVIVDGVQRRIDVGDVVHLRGQRQSGPDLQGRDRLAD